MTAPPAGRVPALAGLAPALHPSVRSVVVIGEIAESLLTQLAPGARVEVVASGVVPSSVISGELVDVVIVAEPTEPDPNDDQGRLLLDTAVSLLRPDGLLVAFGGGIEAIGLADDGGLEPVESWVGVPGSGDSRQVAGVVARVWRRTTRFTVHDLVAEARRGLRRLSVRELHHRLLGDEPVLVLDARTETDRERSGCIAGSLHTPRTVLEWMADPAAGFTHRALASFDQEIVVVCNGGYSSSLAAATLQRLGYRRATDLIGGMTAWLGAGLPVVDPDHAHHDPYVPTLVSLQGRRRERHA